MNKNLFIVFAGAVLVAVLVAMLVRVGVASNKPEPVVQQEARVEILVAAKDLAIGHELQAGDLRWQSWPKGGVFQGALLREGEQTADEALTGRLRRAHVVGEPLARASLVEDVKANFVVASLRPGMRAMAIKVSAETMVGGFIGPGDYVDVLLTYRETVRAHDDDPRVKAMLELNLDKMAIETILQNVKVLAVDQVAQRGKDDKAKVGRTVTVEVDRQAAEKLALASQLGEITLSLRGVGDDEVIEQDWQTMTDARMVKINDELFAEYKRLKEETHSNPSVVRVYNGASVQHQQAR